MIGRSICRAWRKEKRRQMAGGPSAAVREVLVALYPERGWFRLISSDPGLDQAMYGRAIRADEPIVRVMKRPVLTRRSVMMSLRVPC